MLGATFWSLWSARCSAPWYCKGPSACPVSICGEVHVCLSDGFECYLGLQHAEGTKADDTTSMTAGARTGTVAKHSSCNSTAPRLHYPLAMATGEVFPSFWAVHADRLAKSQYVCCI